MAHIDVIKEWAETVRQDIEALKVLIESPKADEHSRRLAGAALLYLVSRMDLVPDWNEGIGALDDVMVLRVIAQLTQTHERGPLPTAAEICLERMANEADRDHRVPRRPDPRQAAGVLRAAHRAGGARPHPAQLVDDAELRKALYGELEEEIKKSLPVVIENPADAEVRLKAYLTHKLQ